MTNQQTYVRRSNAKRAAVADLGKDAVEGRDYQITKGQDGRFAYQRVVSATNPGHGHEGPQRHSTPCQGKEAHDRP